MCTWKKKQWTWIYVNLYTPVVFDWTHSHPSLKNSLHRLNYTSKNLKIRQSTRCNQLWINSAHWFHKMHVDETVKTKKKKQKIHPTQERMNATKMPSSQIIYDLMPKQCLQFHLVAIHFFLSSNFRFNNNSHFSMEIFAFYPLLRMLFQWWSCCCLQHFVSFCVLEMIHMLQVNVNIMNKWSFGLCKIPNIWRTNPFVFLPITFCELLRCFAHSQKKKKSFIFLVFFLS